MAYIEFNLGNPIALNAMLPIAPGAPVGLPPAIGANAGIYIILHQYANPITPENRYMGITNNFQDRFRGRQGACFELGLESQVLNGVNAFLGTMRYRNNGAVGWNNPAGYDAANVGIVLDGQHYDFEQILIKGAQHIWPHGTITNTLKTGVLTNLGANPLDITITWPGGGIGHIAIPVGGNLA